MAFTASLLVKDAFGSKRTQIYKISADAASGTVATGLQYIDAAFISPRSMATAAPKVYENIDSDSSSTANGTVFVSSAANGDVFFLTVYGK